MAKKTRTKSTPKLSGPLTVQLAVLDEAAEKVIKNLPTRVEHPGGVLSSYETAKKAVAACATVDECLSIADKSVALYAYGQQIRDRTMVSNAIRIRMRAIEKAGDLIEEEPPAKNQYDAAKKSAGGRGSTSTSRRAVAEAAGMSKDQQVQAVRVHRGKVKDPEKFESMVESDPPAKIKELEKLGTKLSKMPPKALKAAASFVGAIRRLDECITEYEPQDVAGGIQPKQIQDVTDRMDRIRAWLTKFERQLKEISK